MDTLLDGTAVKVTHHPGLNSVRCVVSCRDLLKVKEESDIIAAMADQKVTGARRINRRGNQGLEPTPTVILTISGTVRPEFIDVGYQRLRTRPYYPSPMLCYQCYAFGHTKARCQQQVATCGNCGQQHAIIQGDQCANPAYCNRCKNGEHPTGSRRCPVYKEEDAIQHIRVDSGISYSEARRLFTASNGQNTYAGVAIQSKDLAIAELRTQVAELAKQMAEKDKTIKALQAHAATSSATINSSPDMEARFNQLSGKLDMVLAELANKDQEIKILKVTTSQKDNELVKCYKKIAALEEKLLKFNGPQQTLSQQSTTDSSKQSAPQTSSNRSGKGGKDSVTNRLELIRTHGTIEDLVAKNKHLKQREEKQQQTIELLRNERDRNTAGSDGKQKNTPTEAKVHLKKPLVHSGSEEKTSKRQKNSSTETQHIDYSMTISDDDNPSTQQPTTQKRITRSTGKIKSTIPPGLFDSHEEMSIDDPEDTEESEEQMP